MKKLHIGTVTYGDRWKYLSSTINSFIDNTNLENIDWEWFIYANNPIGQSLDFLHGLEDLSPRFTIEYSSENRGIGPAMDFIRNYVLRDIPEFANELDRDIAIDVIPYLFLEDDWVCLPSELTGVDKDWLLNAMSIIEEKDADIIYFRRYVDIFDAKKHFWHDKRNEYTFAPEPRDLYFSGMRAIRLNPTFWNNPHLMNLRAPYDIYPLVREDRKGIAETKDSPTWGASENQATWRISNRPVKTFYAFNGIFAHYDYLLYHYNADDIGRFIYDHPFDKNQYNYISNVGL